MAIMPRTGVAAGMALLMLPMAGPARAEVPDDSCLPAASSEDRQQQERETGVPDLVAGSGRFTVKGGAGRENRTIEVHYHCPGDLTRQSPVLMVMPGAGRNGDDYRDAFVDAAEEHGVLILSPSYPERHYPEYWSYNLGNMPDSVTLEFRMRVDTNPDEWQLSDLAASLADDPGLAQLAHANPVMHQFALMALAGMIVDMDGEATGLTVNRDRRAWIYPDFDRIFETVRSTLGLETRSYDLFGHSAGGQILHRFALFHPRNRAERILAANSGWYTLPEFETPFPYGLKNTGMKPEEIRRAFQSRLVVFLGEEDDETETRGSLRETPEANRQGPGRLQRGRHFFEKARAAAERLDTELNWRLEVVPGVGHDYRRMALKAAEYLYEEH